MLIAFVMFIPAVLMLIAFVMFIPAVVMLTIAFRHTFYAAVHIVTSLT
jgi:hypothetical protein